MARRSHSTFQDRQKPGAVGVTGGPGEHPFQQDDRRRRHAAPSSGGFWREDYIDQGTGYRPPMVIGCRTGGIGVYQPIIQGFIKIEAQTSYGGNPCGTWRDVTQEILASVMWERTSIRRRSTTLVRPPVLGSLSPRSFPFRVRPIVALAAQSGMCGGVDPHPKAVIRLERVRDNPSNGSAESPQCGGTPRA